MDNVKHHRLGSIFRFLVMAAVIFSLTLGTGQVAQASTFRAPVNLGTASHFAILTKTGITNVPASAITGDLGVSPAAASYITGFSLIMDSTNTFSKSSQVTGKIYAANYAAPTPANMTTAISNMQTAYSDAAGRTLPDYTELFAGNLSGRTLSPGLYKWSTGVLVNSAVTLSGPADAVWIFQIAGNLTMGSGAKVILSGGAKASNIFWQVGGGVGVEIGTTAHMEGTLLAQKAIHIRTGASLNGRALSQTAVTLDHNTIVLPPSVIKVAYFTSQALLDGYTLESGENTNMGGSLNSTAGVIVAGDNAQNKQYRSILSFDTSSLPDRAVVTSARISIMKQGMVGTNPFTTLRYLLVDIRKPYFGTSSSLQLSDFQAYANSNWAGTFGKLPVNGWYSASLNPSGKLYVNRSGITQFRVRFSLDDNNNNIADYIKFYSGNSLTASRPRLVISYYVP